MLLTGCFRTAPESGGSEVLAHDIFDSLLKKYVDEEGLVNYEGFFRERELLREYLHQLDSNTPGQNWAMEERLAYWINAYNAYTIELVLEYQPKRSIREIGSDIQLPFVNTPWQIDFIEIGGKKYNLDDIEHGIIRKNFKEPRIHFALVCASLSCPKLRQEAYTGLKLNDQLDDQARDFLSDMKRNQISSKKLRLSKIFQYYADDFTEHGSLLEYINQFAPVTIYDDATVEFMEYDWNLNTQN